MDYERCELCDKLTGGAGRLDDSIVCSECNKVICEDCGKNIINSEVVCLECLGFNLSDEEFSELHGHTEMSNFRLLDSINKVEDYVNYAYKMGLNAVAITDHETVSAHIKGIKAYKEIKKNDADTNFKLILGNEIYLVDKMKELPSDKIDYHHFLLLARNKKGHKVIRELSSRAWSNSYTDRAMERVPTLKSWVEEMKDEIKGNVYGSTACLGSEFSKLVLEYLDTNSLGVKHEINDFIKWNIDIFGADGFFIELQSATTVEQIEYNKFAIVIAKAYSLKWIITNDIHYLNKTKRKVHSNYLKSKQEEREVDSFYNNTYFKNIKEMQEQMDYLSDKDFKDGINNTVFISNNIETYDLNHEVIVPELTLPEFELDNIFSLYYDKYEYINKFANSMFNQDKYMLYLIEKGFKRFNQKYNEENLARIDIELKQLWNISIKLGQRLSAYYNLTERLVEIMWDDNLGNSLVGVARGSVTGFYTCYLMEIIQINPIEYDLPYWRHISESRPELPDIDLDSQSSRRAFIFDSIKQEIGYENGLNIITFTTEATKSALLTSCRGLDIDIDLAQEMSDLIPSERGFLWSLKDCIYGNEELGRKVVTQLVNVLKIHENLIETALGIEGLINGRSSHASGFYIFKNGFIEQNALMKSPKGQFITQFNMEDSDYLGGLKVDCLTIKALDKQRKTLDLLMADGLIKWQGTLKATYDEYLLPSVINLNNVEMWANINNEVITDLFQFETMMGSQTIKLLQPKNIEEMAIGNSAMRLQAEDGGQSPLEMFAMNKNNIDIWYKMAREYGLTEEEINILEKHLGKRYMLAIEQEDIMELSMDEKISGFDLVKANKLRKAVAKKKKDILSQVKEIFYEGGLKLNTREKFLDFVWDKAIMLQAGYGFSKNHTVPYSMIGVQEAWLATNYSPIYWNTACLTINSESSQEELFDEDDKNTKTTQYGKIAKAISRMQSRGIAVTLPNINKANFEFTPDSENNKIIFGLKGISHVNDDLANNIIKNRPFKDIVDFIDKVEPTKIQTIFLTKGGAFDTFLEDGAREDLMKEILKIFAVKEIGENVKESLTMSNFNAIIELGILPEDEKIFIRHWKFKKYVLQNCFKCGKIRNKLYYKTNNASKLFFEQFYCPNLEKDSDYWYEEDVLHFYKSSYDKVYLEMEDKIRELINTEDFINTYNQSSIDSLANESWDKYCDGTISKWEMDSISYYYHEHELANIQKSRYNISDFASLPEEPLYSMELHKKSGREWKKYDLSRISGTVLDVNKLKHIVYILTTDGVVNVKFYGGSFVNYNKTLSQTVYDESKKKNVKKRVEESWFKRGNKIMVAGFRSGDYFIPKKYYNSVFNHTVAKIEEINNDGSLVINTERIKI